MWVQIMAVKDCVQNNTATSGKLIKAWGPSGT